MTKESKLYPCRFDDKDFILPEFWECYFDNSEHIPYCLGNNGFDSLFFLHYSGSNTDCAYKAHIVAREYNIIEVTALQHGGRFWDTEIVRLKSLFMDEINDDLDHDTRVVCETRLAANGDVNMLVFRYFHTID